MKNILVRTAVVAFFAVGPLTALCAAPKPGPNTPIPICWQCGGGSGNNGN